jgi:hypothetical protein
VVDSQVNIVDIYVAYLMMTTMALPTGAERQPGSAETFTEGSGSRPRHRRAGRAGGEEKAASADEMRRNEEKR